MVTSSDNRKRLAAAGILGVLGLVASFEGLRTAAYLDPVGIPTVCFGETKNVKLGDKSTPEHCEDLLASRLLEFNRGISSCIKVPISPTERQAYISFSYNVGVKAFCTSLLLEKLNQNDHLAACAQLSRWTKAGGKVLPGLVIRRAEERSICEVGLLK